MSAATAIGEDSVPRLPRGVRLHFDKQRDQWVLLAPERVFVLDPIAVEVVKRCDGEATLGVLVDDLAQTFQAPRETILGDVRAMLQGLIDKKVIAA